MELPQRDDYLRLFADDIPLLDVRAPVEFLQGAFPLASNLPLINDDERMAIGIRYKEQGQEKAIELGHTLVQGEIKADRVNRWAEFTQRHPQGALYCFRGGMRSKISQRWIFEQTGVVYPRIKGGYKAMRRFLIEQLDSAAQTMQPVILGGRTGVGKTALLQRLQHKVDLEGIYRHRGSAFGKHVTPQPTQIDIENTLSITLLKHRRAGVTHLLLEDEAASIGSRRLPDSVVQRMQQSPVLLLEAGLSQRVDIVFQEYIVEALTEYQNHLGETAGFDAWAASLGVALEKIQRRLGGPRFQKLKAVMQDAMAQHRTRQNEQHHKEWIKALLADYYDPMYDYQIEKKSERVVFRGDRESVLRFLRQHYAIQ